MLVRRRSVKKILVLQTKQTGQIVAFYNMRFTTTLSKLKSLCSFADSVTASDKITFNAVAVFSLIQNLGHTSPNAAFFGFEDANSHNFTKIKLTRQKNDSYTLEDNPAPAKQKLQKKLRRVTHNFISCTYPSTEFAFASICCRMLDKLLKSPPKSLISFSFLPALFSEHLGTCEFCLTETDRIKKQEEEEQEQEQRRLQECFISDVLKTEFEDTDVQRNSLPF
jgi:hypothetical protein